MVDHLADEGDNPHPHTQFQHNEKTFLYIWFILDDEDNLYRLPYAQRTLRNPKSTP